MFCSVSSLGTVVFFMLDFYSLNPSSLSFNIVITFLFSFHSGRVLQICLLHYRFHYEHCRLSTLLLLMYFQFWYFTFSIISFSLFHLTLYTLVSQPVSFSPQYVFSFSHFSSPASRGPWMLFRSQNICCLKFAPISHSKSFSKVCFLCLLSAVCSFFKVTHFFHVPPNEVLFCLFIHPWIMTILSE